MKPLIIASALLVLAAPAFASPRHPTSAQQKDLDRYSDAFMECQNYNPDNASIPEYAVPEEENQRHKKACDRSHRLVSKLVKQGFCFYNCSH
jgi:hypothetical protein